jgi:phosphatidylglycerol:prolipoprotein diacylglycerol transferase
MAISSLLYIVWDVEPRVFSFSEIPRWYGICWVIGMALGYQVMLYIYKKETKSEEQLHTLALYLIIGAVVGARMGHILFYDPVYYWNHPMEILPIKLYPTFQFTGFAGLASHGGAIGVLMATYLYSRKYRKNFLWTTDRLVIAAALVGCFIRLGNLMNSEVIGTPTNVPWAFVFVRVDAVPRHPAQLYEAIYCLLLFMGLFYLWSKKRWDISNGKLFGTFLVTIFTLRFIDEFFKIDQEPFESSLPLNMGQLLSIPFVLVGIWMLIYSNKKK